MNHRLIGLIGVISFGLIILVSLSGFGLVGLRGINGLIVRIGLICLVDLSGFGLISLVGVSGLDLVGLDSLIAAIISAAAAVLAMHAEATKLTSATKIVNKAIFYYSDASSHHVYSLVRETMWWWLALARKKMWWWIASFGYSNHNDVFKYCLATAILAAAVERMS